MKPEEMEDCLGRLAPARPSERLRRRFGFDCADLRMPTHAIRWWLTPLAWASLGAAIALVADHSIDRRSPPAVTVATNAAQAPPQIREWIAQDPPEIAFSKDLLPERRVRIVGVERREWLDPKTGERMTAETPMERTVVVPASFQ